jgi:methyl coenzyme M reductase subunit C
MCRRKKCAVLTETPVMKVKPGSSITPNAEITYKICNSAVNHSVIIDASGSGTYPNAAINKTGLDEQSEDPIDPNRSAAFM